MIMVLLNNSEKPANVMAKIFQSMQQDLLLIRKPHEYLLIETIH